MISLSPHGTTSFDLADGPPLRLLVGTVKGVVAVERANAEAPWRVTETTLVSKAVSALVHGSGGLVFAGVYGGGVLRSSDDGRTWQAASRGLTNLKIYSLGLAKTPGGDVLYAGTEPVALFTSTDDGDHWRELPQLAEQPGREKWTFPAPPHAAHTKSLTIDREQPTTVYAAVEQGGLFKSVDAGATWTEIDGYQREDDQVYRDIHRVVQAPWKHALLFLATGDGLSRSTDGGRTWQQHAALKRAIGYPDVMEASLRDDRTVLVAGARYNPREWFSTGVAAGTLYRSRDDGETWEPADAGLPRDARANIEALTLAAHAGGVSAFVGTTDGEVFASDDLGAFWTRIATGIPPVSKRGHDGLLKVVSSVPGWFRPVFAAFAAFMNGLTSRISRMVRGLAKQAPRT